MDKLKASTEIEVRFSEVDSMNIVWHGAYSLYFEDAREAFGKKYGLGYLDILAMAIMRRWLTCGSVTRNRWFTDGKPAWTPVFAIPKPPKSSSTTKSTTWKTAH